MRFLLFLVLIFAVGIKASLLLKGADQTFFASAGEDVILNCSVDSHQSVHGIEEISWKKKDGDVLVLLFQDNEVFSDSSHESYQGRAEFFITEIPKGNFSLKLKDVRLEDKGEFICEIHTRNTSSRTIVDLRSVDHLKLKGADQAIVATGGEEVILNCSLDSHIPAHEIEEVTWKIGDLLILLFQNNQTFSDSSHENYEGRAEFFITEIAKGNFSLKLKDVRMEDKGEYICEIHTSHMSARTIVDLLSVDYSARHISILVLCFAVMLFTVGFCFPTFNLLRKKVPNRMDLIMQTTLILFPNICMCVAFILWLKEGFLSEAVICSVVCIVRPIMLIKSSPYLNTLPDIIMLSECKDHMMSLENALKDQTSEKRSRKLTGEDLAPEDLIKKIEQLEVQLTEKEAQLMEKELIYEQVTRLSQHICTKAENSKEDTLGLAKKINEVQGRIKKCTKKLMAVVSELAMRQAQALCLQQDLRERELQLDSCHRRLDLGLAPSDEIEQEWQRYIRDLQKRQADALEKGQMAEEEEWTELPNGVYTTSELRPTAYIPVEDSLPLPKPYGALAPFKPTKPGTNIRHIRKPVFKPIEI